MSYYIDKLNKNRCKRSKRICVLHFHMYKLVHISFDIRICLSFKNVSNGYVFNYINTLLKENTKGNLSKSHHDPCQKRLTLCIRGILGSNVFKDMSNAFQYFVTNHEKNMLILTILIVINDFRGTFFFTSILKTICFKSSIEQKLFRIDI